jgi:hypothetical protein
MPFRFQDAYNYKGCKERVDPTIKIGWIEKNPFLTLDEKTVLL